MFRTWPRSWFDPEGTSPVHAVVRDLASVWWEVGCLVGSATGTAAGESLSRAICAALGLDWARRSLEPALTSQIETVYHDRARHAVEKHSAGDYVRRGFELALLIADWLRSDAALPCLQSLTRTYWGKLLPAHCLAAELESRGVRVPALLRE
jgi:hypothetical protein